MVIILICCIFAVLYFLIVKNIFKLNKYSAPTLVVVISILTSLVFMNFDRNENYSNIQGIQNMGLNKRDLEKNEGIPHSVVTDNINLYSIINNKLIISDVTSLETIKEIQYNLPFKPMSIMLSKNKLIVIGESDNTSTEVLIYNKNDYQLFKQIKIDAKYVESKLINDDVYLVTSGMIEHSNQKQKLWVNSELKELSKISHINKTYSKNYITVLKVNLKNRKDYQALSYLGLGYTVYFSENDLYIAEEMFSNDQDVNQSIILKINLKTLKLTHTQELKGLVLNEHSMNEYQNELRVATSEGYDEYFTNHLYKLDKNLKVMGKLEDFLTGHQIQAATFINHFVYLDTYNDYNKMVVVDLQDKNPKIISESNFIGYHTYLFPYDDHHIIGLGLVLNKDKIPEGIKISLFNVSDGMKLVSQDIIPYQEYPDAFTEAMYDSKALLVDYENKVIGFPVLYWTGVQPYPYKQLYFVYQVDQRLKRLGTISHFNNEVDEHSEVKQGLVINNKLYTISNHKIIIHQLSDLKLLKEKVLK